MWQVYKEHRDVHTYFFWLLFPLPALWTPDSQSTWTLAWRVIKLVWLSCPQNNSQVTLELKAELWFCFLFFLSFLCLLEALFKNPLNCFWKWVTVHLPKHHVGGGILLSVLYTQRNDAANYICPVWMCPCVPQHCYYLWCSRRWLRQLGREREPGPYSLCGVYREPRTLLSRSYFRFVGVGRWGRKEGTGYFLEENGVGGEGIIHCN